MDNKTGEHLKLCFLWPQQSDKVCVLGGEAGTWWNDFCMNAPSPALSLI